MSTALTNGLLARADGLCELCRQGVQLKQHPVYGGPAGDDGHIALCTDCAARLGADTDLNPDHWSCLHEAIWSAVPAVQVQSCRIARRLPGAQWAVALLDQVWLDDELKAWLEAEPEPEDDDPLEANVVKDINGVVLAAGDTVSLTKSLDVKGANFTAKQGTMVRRIRLCDVKAHILGRVNGQEIYIKGCYLKRISTAGD